MVLTTVEKLCPEKVLWMVFFIMGCSHIKSESVKCWRSLTIGGWGRRLVSLFQANSKFSTNEISPPMILTFLPLSLLKWTFVCTFKIVALNDHNIINAKIIAWSRVPTSPGALLSVGLISALLPLVWSRFGGIWGNQGFVGVIAGSPAQIVCWVRSSRGRGGVASVASGG